VAVVRTSTLIAYDRKANNSGGPGHRALHGTMTSNHWLSPRRASPVSGPKAFSLTPSFENACGATAGSSTIASSAEHYLEAHHEPSQWRWVNDGWEG